MLLFEIPKKQMPIPKALHEKYVVPPFSVFNTHQTYWRERMRFWRSMGLCGTNGRKAGMSYDNRRMEKNPQSKTGTSIFSPVLTEIVYKWFTIPNSRVFDPFAGGITRGAIAAIYGHRYVGLDVNPVQVESNKVEYESLITRYKIDGSVRWICGASQDNVHKEKLGKFDFIFTCPPYYNLEQYTDDPKDLSNAQSYADFLDNYVNVLELCYNVLEDDSFMVWVVSDVRDKQTTAYYGLVADTIKAAQLTGFKLYNEIILYNDTGNLAIVSGDYLERARKVGRQHQNVLVFYKGNPKNIKYKYGSISEG